MKSPYCSCPALAYGHKVEDHLRPAFEAHRLARTGQKPEAVYDSGKDLDPLPPYPLPGRYRDHADNEAWHAWRAALSQPPVQSAPPSERDKVREECARQCDELADRYQSQVQEAGDRDHGKAVAANTCAAAIRATKGGAA